MKRKLKQILSGAGVIGVLAGTFYLGRMSGQNYDVKKSDVNNDGLEDVIVSNREDAPRTLYFIRQKDGSYDKTVLIGRDGIGFLVGEKNDYDFHGNILPRFSDNKTD